MQEENPLAFTDNNTACHLTHARQQDSVSTLDLTSKGFHWDADDTRIQHDVQELNKALYSAIEDSLANLPSGQDVIERLYRVKTRVEVLCMSCKQPNDTPAEDNLDLVIGVQGVHALIRASFLLLLLLQRLLLLLTA